MKPTAIFGLCALLVALAACSATAASSAAAPKDSQSAADGIDQQDVAGGADTVATDVAADAAAKPDGAAPADVAAAPDSISFGRGGKKYDMAIGIGANYVGATKIMIVSGTLLSPMMSITLTIEANAPGTYSCKTGATSVTHVGPNAAGTNISFKAASAIGDCSIVVTEYGAVGGKVSGTFTASVVGNGETVGLTDGTFSVTRKADQ